MSPQDQLLIARLITYLYAVPLLISIAATIILRNKVPDKWEKMDRYISWALRITVPIYNWYTSIVFIGSLISVSWTWFIVDPFRHCVKEIAFHTSIQLLPDVIWLSNTRTIIVLFPFYAGVTFYLRD